MRRRQSQGPIALRRRPALQGGADLPVRHLANAAEGAQADRARTCGVPQWLRVLAECARPAPKVKQPLHPGAFALPVAEWAVAKLSLIRTVDAVARDTPYSCRSSVLTAASYLSLHHAGGSWERDETPGVVLRRKTGRVTHRMGHEKWRASRLGEPVCARLAGRAVRREGGPVGSLGPIAARCFCAAVIRVGARHVGDRTRRQPKMCATSRCASKSMAVRPMRHSVASVASDVCR